MRHCPPGHRSNAFNAIDTCSSLSVIIHFSFTIGRASYRSPSSLFVHPPTIPIVSTTHNSQIIFIPPTSPLGVFSSFQHHPQLSFHSSRNKFYFVTSTFVSGTHYLLLGIEASQLGGVSYFSGFMRIRPGHFCSSPHRDSHPSFYTWRNLIY
jgi:hypothetical protein